MYCRYPDTVIWALNTDTCQIQQAASQGHENLHHNEDPGPGGGVQMQLKLRLVALGQKLCRRTRVHLPSWTCDQRSPFY